MASREELEAVVAHVFKRLEDALAIPEDAPGRDEKIDEATANYQLALEAEVGDEDGEKALKRLYKKSVSFAKRTIRNLFVRLVKEGRQVDEIVLDDEGLLKLLESRPAPLPPPELESARALFVAVKQELVEFIAAKAERETREAAEEKLPPAVREARKKQRAAVEQARIERAEKEKKRVKKREMKKGDEVLARGESLRIRSEAARKLRLAGKLKQDEARRLRAEIDRELVKRYKRGDDRALETLLNHYSKLIVWIAKPIVGGDVQSAYDAEAQVYKNVHRHLKKWQGRSRFFSWLYRIAYNAAKTLAIKYAKMREAEQAAGVAGLLPVDYVEPEQEARLIAAEEEAEQASYVPERDIEESVPRMEQKRTAELRAKSAALSAIPKNQQEIMGLLLYKGKTYAEIAAELGIPMGTVMSRIHNARRNLQRVLDGDVVRKRGRPRRGEVVPPVVIKPVIDPLPKTKQQIARAALTAARRRRKKTFRYFGGRLSRVSESAKRRRTPPAAPPAAPPPASPPPAPAPVARDDRPVRFGEWIDEPVAEPAATKPAPKPPAKPAATKPPAKPSKPAATKPPAKPSKPAPPAVVKPPAAPPPAVPREPEKPKVGPTGKVTIIRRRRE